MIHFGMMFHSFLGMQSAVVAYYCAPHQRHLASGSAGNAVNNIDTCSAKHTISLYLFTVTLQYLELLIDAVLGCKPFVEVLVV